MRLLIFLNTCLFLSNLSFGQTSKQLFKDIRYATYHLDNVSKPEVDFYVDIDQSGMMKVYQKFDGVIKTFISRLSDNDIDTLNLIFNGSQKLQSSLAKTKLETGEHYAGAYHFIIYIDSKGVSDSLSFIPSFMSDTFNASFEKIEEIFYNNRKQSSQTQLKADSKFLKSLEINHKKASYLPVIEEPPPEQP